MKANQIEFYLDNPVIDYEPGILLVKDLQHRFVASSRGFEAYSGVSATQLVGLSDTDMPWRDYADMFVANEKETLSGLNYITIEPLHGLKCVTLITMRVIVYDSLGLPSGIASNSIPIDSNFDLSSLFSFGFVQKISKNPLPLTKTESLVLHLVLLGIKRREISKQLNLTSSAYDFHIRNIKRKLNASSTSELVAIAHKLGLDGAVNFVIKAPMT
ncbi:TPA: LuxR C-terminal-related transcriptional regulator [Aeromonas veronii]